jgi:tetratricopeptide (TPR) repeat protein
MGRLHGTTPVSRLCEWLDEHEAQEPGLLALREARAVALAMLGQLSDARTILRDLREALADRGATFQLGDVTAHASVDVELLAGDPAAAAEYGEEGCRLLEQLGEKSLLSTAAAKLAQALFALGRVEDADRWASRAEKLGASDDAYTQMLWRQARARVLAHRGEYSEAERLAHGAVAIGQDTDMLDAQGDT